MNIYDLLEEFCAHKRYLRGVSLETEKRYKEKISFFIKNRDISTINNVDRRTVTNFFIHGSAERRWKASTYNTYHITLHTFLSGVYGKII